MGVKQRSRQRQIIILCVSGGLVGLLVLLMYDKAHTVHTSAINKGVGTESGAARRDLRADVCAVANHHANLEYWGEVVKASGEVAPNTDGVHAANAQECCMACQVTRGCNIWVYCGDPSKCGSQCWLKRAGKASQVHVHDQGPHVAWTSGLVPKDFDRDVESLPPVDDQIEVVALDTQYGRIRIKLKPQWSLSSVTYVRRLAMSPELCTPSCEFYRAEPSFLLQGSLRGFIPPNNITTPGPKLMERGEIGWAGGSAGPDFFIYLGSEPAAHWKHDHTVWGVIADEESLKVVEKINSLPAKAPRPGDMHMLEKRVSFSTAVAKAV